MVTGSLNAQLVIEGDINVDCDCPSGGDGFLDISVSGGTPPYTYAWTLNGSEVICNPRVDFSGLDGIGCTPSGPGEECSPVQGCAAPSNAINAQNFVIGDAVLTVSPPIANGGACIDENLIDDSTLDGFFAIRTGVSQLGNPGPAANVTRTWTFSNPVCDLQILLNDIDGEDAIIVNGKLNGATIPLTGNDFIITNTTPDPACPVFVGGNTWQSQGGCPASDNTDRGGILITFPSCLDEIEFIYYDYSGAASAGGSYAVGFSNICAADLQCLEGGVYQVEVTDANGLTGNAQFTVEVLEGPINIVCPDDIVTNTDQGACDAIVNWPPPLLEDGCSPQNLICTHESGDIFPIGTTTVSCTGTDNFGNTSTCDFDITVNYGFTPTLVCPIDITVNADQGSCIAPGVSWVPPTLDNGCSLTTLTSNFQPGDDFPTGTTTVTYTGNDSGGNTFECSFDVTVINTGVPLILNCPDDIMLTTTGGQCDAVATWTPPTPDPTCDATITSSTNNPGDSFPIGTTTVTYVVTDSNGNTNECSFDVTVDYDFTPTLVCPADIAVDAEVGTCVATSVTWDPPTLDNGCDLVTLTSNFQSGDDFPTGTTIVTYAGTDSGGNIFICSFNITVTNTGLPIILNCPNDITLNAAPGACDAAVIWTPPTPDPNCDAIVSSSSHEPGDVFPAGTTTVTYVIIDGSGTTNTCSFDVTVNYDVNPTLVCPADISVDAEVGECFGSATWMPPTLSNDCELTTLISNFDPGDNFPAGTTTVTYTGTTEGGLIFECSFDVTVINDEQTIVLECPDDINLVAAAGECDAVATWTPPVPNADCGAVLTGSNFNPGDVFPIGTTTVIYTAEDQTGNQFECSFDITVTYNSTPTLVCPPNISVNADVNSCTTNVSWTPPTLSNDCSLTTLTGNFDPGDVFPTGTTTVTYNGTDGLGNVFTCSFDVTVINTGVPLILNCPSNISASTNAGQCEAVVTWTPPTPDQNCDIISIVSTNDPGDTFPIGTTTVTYTVTDSNGNTNECSFDITVTYDSNPTLVCPNNISVDADAGSCTATSVSWTPPTLSNDCSLTTLTSNFEPGDDFPTGTTTVTYTGTDSGGNVFTCSFDVIVTNTGVPLILNCPDDITISAGAGECESAVSWTPPTPDPNCDAVITSSTHDPGDIFSIGTTTVTYVITDSNGNTNECSFDVTINYDVTPTLVCPNDIEVDADIGSCLATAVNWIPPSLSNGCELITLTSNFQPGDDFPTGTTTVTYTGTDSGGNIFECSFDVIVTNTDVPLILNCPDDIIFAAGGCDAEITWTPPTPDPNCDAVITSASHEPGDDFPIGTTTVTYVVTDGSGNTSICSFDITVTFDVTPTLVCPDDITVNADPNSCTATAVNWLTPSLSNGCNLAELTGNFQPGDSFPTGTTTVTYTGMDSNENVFECSFTVTVINTGVPIILNCPDDIELTLAAGECDTAVNWVPPSPDPNCDAVITSSSHNPGDIFPPGTTTVTYVVTDGSGNTNVCIFDVTINFNSNPTLVCPDDISVNAPVGECVTSVAWVPPTLSNGCELATLTSNFDPGDNFPAGTTTVTYTGMTGGGLTFECSFEVTVVNDEQTTVLECPDDVNLVAAAGQCEAVGTWTEPIPDENCGVVITGSTHVPGDVFPIGTTTVTYTAEDQTGNQFECSFDITITYTSTPTLVCPSDISTTADAGSCTATAVTWTPPTLSDDCELTTLTSNFEPGDDFPTGTTIVTYTGTDALGNVFECSFNVTVVNNGPPIIINCPTDITIATTPGQCEASATWLPPTVDENCDATITSSSHNPGDMFPVGTTTVTYIATDGNGQEAICSFDITVVYDQTPLLFCPQSITLNASPGACVAALTWVPPTLSNNCDLLTLTSNFEPGDLFPVGTTTVIYTATDLAGNTFECDFNIIINSSGPPLILDCPNDINVQVAAGQCDAAATWTPPTPDPNCNAVITSSSHNPGDLFPIGTTTVTYVIADESGQQSICSFDITVTYDSNPTLVCPSDITVNAAPAACTASATWTPPTLSNDCELTNLTSNFEPGDALPIGTTTITYSGSDAAGNTFECSFDVTVIGDDQAGALICPNDVTISVIPGQCEASVTWTPPQPDPNCGITVVGSNFEPGDIFPIGTATVTYTAINDNGNTIECSFDITVTYSNAPVLICPQDIEVDALPGTCSSPVTWAPPIFSSICGLATLTGNYEPGDNFPIGTTTVTYTGVDGGGNVFTCGFDVIVTGGGNPVFLNCPADIDLVAAPGECDAIATWIPPTVDENCGFVITSSSHDPGDTFPAGTTTVTYIATDPNGNTIECAFDVNIAYDVIPTLVCPSDITVDAAAGACTAIVTWGAITLSNDCGLSTVTGTYESGDALPIGTTTVTYTAEDFGGNVFECSFEVTVNGDIGASALVCPDDITQSVTPGQCATSVIWTPPMPDPNCGIIVTSSSHEPGDVFPIGTTTVTYNAIDDNGNTLECTFDITVTYSDNPILICPNNITVDAIQGTCSAPVTWAPPIFSSTCGLATLTGNFEPGDSFPLGTTTVTYIGIDTGGNEFTCSFDVTVNSNGTPAFLNCPNNVNLVAAPGQCEASVTWTPPTIDENCGISTINSTHEPGDIFPAGTTTVTYTAMDSDGNQFECSFEVRVEYNVTPTLVCPSDVTVDAQTGACTATATWDLPTLSNDCGLSVVTGNFEPGDVFPIGTTMVTYTGEDFGGNIFVCSFDVTVNGDIGASPLVCPDDITQSVIPGQCEASVTWEPPVPDPNCGIIITGSNFEPGDNFPIGTTTVTYTAIDAGGNTLECSFDITVTYSDNPILICPNNITVDAVAGTCTASVTWSVPIFSSTCGLASLTGNFEPGDNFPIGTTTVTYEGVDGGGNIFTCSFDVSVNSNGPPVIVNCPNDISLTAAAGACEASVTWMPPVVDENCDAVITSSSHEPGDVFPAGTTTVTYVATNTNGDEATCSFDINVAYNVTPTLVCPNDITINAQTGACTASVTWALPTLSNDCGLSTVTGDFDPGDAFPVGTTTVTYTAEDFGGNVFECSFDVTVIGDNQDSPLVCPNDITVSVVPGQCETSVTWQPPVPDPNCGITITGSNFEPGDIFPIGTTTVIYTATDLVGNTIECSFDITVTYAETPELVCPEDITVDAVAGTCAASVTWSIPIFTSTCGLVNLAGDYAPGDDFPIGTTTVTYEGTDGGGNIFTCSFNVTVNSTGPPIILNCPNDISLTAAPGACDASVTWTPPVVDENCDAIITSSSHEPGDIFPAGTTTVTYIATDSDGNETTCSFDVNVAYDINPTLVCPNNITIDAQQGACTAPVNWELPTLSNDCGLSTVTGSSDPGDSFPIGTTTVTYTGEDFGGNIFECSFEVTVTGDVGASPLVCPDDITIGVASGQCETAVTWEPPIPDPNCGITITGSTHVPGDIFAIGTTTVTYTAADEAGNIIECSFDITVTYQETPELICPEDITVDAVEGTCTASVTWSVPIFSSTCGLDDLQGDYEPGDEFPIGTTLVTYTGIDSGGNVFICTFNVTVNSNGPPVILDCPADVTVSTAPGECDATATWTLPVIDENCDATITSSSHNPGNVFPVGITTVTYVVTDGSGNEAICSFDVIVGYDATTTLVCPLDITVNASSGSCTTSVTWTPPTLSNDCVLTNLASNFESGDNFPAGISTVTYIGTDASGGTFECSFTITVLNDNETSVFDCPNDITIPLFQGQCQASVVWEPPVPNVECGVTITGSSHEPGDIFSVGTTTVIYTAVDGAGNAFQCDFDITIVYGGTPELACPDDITLNTNIGTCTTTVTWTPPLLDNGCELSTLVSNYEPGDVFPTGTTTVTYTGADTGGNVFECSFDVVVVNSGLPIILNCPDDIDLVADTNNGQCEAVATWEPPMPDENCDIISVVASHDPGDSFPIGTTTVTYVVTDGSGNTNTCSFDVNIAYDFVPTLTCPSDIIVNAEPNSCLTAVSWELPTLTNGCDLATLTSNYDSSDNFPAGTTSVSYVGVDSGGNTFECSFDITVINDGQTDVWDCPENITTLPAPGACEAVAFWEPPVPDANCGITVTGSNYEPGDIFPVGTTTVIYTATDAVGNVFECTFDVIVSDVQPIVDIVCQDNIINIFTEEGGCDAVVVWNPPIIIDNCASEVTFTSTHQSGDVFPIGTTTVTYTATDPGGNTASCSFDVTVIDKEPPTINCPDDITVDNSPGQCFAAVSWQVSGVNDNCGVASIMSTHEPGDIFPVGVTTVEYIISDAEGNTVECSFNVTVEDNEDPQVLACPSNIVISTDPGQCSAVVNWEPPTTVDNCSSIIAGSTHTPGALFPLGTTTVLYGILDGAGNGTTCVFTVTVVDEEAPTMECPADITVSTDPGQCSAAVNWTVPTPIDNCGAGITSISHTPGDIFPVGTTTVSYTATDITGAQVSCSFNVTVVDTEIPTVTCPEDIIATSAPGQCGRNVNWSLPALDDNCDVTDISISHQPGDFFPVGDTPVTYTLTDAAGNTTECGFIVTVRDIEPPVVQICPEDIVINSEPGACGAFVDWSVPIVADNCQAAPVGSTHVPGSFFPIGTTLVLYGILDEAGNGNVCFFNITVLDSEPPVIDCPADITVFNDEGECGAAVSWTVPTPIDNCGTELTSSSHNPGDIFPIGTTTVTYTAVAEDGTEISCSFDITVSDKEVPTITCPDDITVGTDMGVCDAVVSWDAPMFSDNCSDASITSTASSGDTFGLGTNTVTYTVTDDEGNTTDCSFNITVEDREPPMVTGCPDDIVVSNDPGACSAVVSWEPPTFTDNCEILNIDSKPNPGSLFPIGTTNVVYEAIDASGNITSCTFTVTVEDTEDPTLACPADITVSNDDGECGAVVNWTPPVPIDNCGAEITGNTHNPGDFFPVGTTTVTYTTVNSEGVELVCSFDVTVEDIEDPVLVCPADITVPFDNGACDAVVTWDISVLDNCEAQITSSTHNSGDAFEIGTTTVTYTAEDAEGNTHICSFDVTVTDNEPPVILNCPEDIVVAGPPGDCVGPVVIAVPQFGIDFTDCQSTTITNSYNTTSSASDIYPVGTTVITWIATDASGNSTTCEQAITVTPTDFTDDVALVTDKDVFVGAGFDNADFGDSDSIIIIDPGVPDNAVVNSILLDFFFRPEGNSCETHVEVEVTDPAGTVFPVFVAPTGNCDGNDALFQFFLPVASVPSQSSGGGVWKLRFRDTEDDNPVSAGPIGVSTPAGTEFSVRFGRITYDITVSPDCEDAGNGGGGGVVDDPDQLPIELSYFKGTEEDCEAILSWGTASEVNVSHFEIQRSYDGLTFITIDRLDALGAEGIATDYMYSDAQLTLTNYYRLRIVDNDGQVEYSDIFTIQADCAGGVSISEIFPNPTVNQLINVQFNSNVDHEDAKLVVRDMLGRTMMEVPITIFLGSNLITVDPTRLPAAQYVLIIEGADWRSSAERFIKLD